MIYGVVLLFLALYLVSYVEVLESCSNGFVSHQNSCYLFSHETATWADAVLTCQLLDSTLVEIEDSIENTYLKNVVKGRSGAGWYIGATDKAVEGEFVWMNSKTTFSNQQTFKDWYPGEPRNTNYDEGCVVIWKAYGLKWGDISCEFKGNYICERQLSDRQTGAPDVIG